MRGRIVKLVKRPWQGFGLGKGAAKGGVRLKKCAPFCCRLPVVQHGT